MEKNIDKLKDYFYNRCSQDEEIEIQKWLAENNDDKIDEVFQRIISEIRIKDITISQKAFDNFRLKLESRKTPSSKIRLKKAVWLIQRIAAVLFIPLLCFCGYLYLKEDTHLVWNDITVPHGTQQVLTLADGTTLHVNSGTRVIYPSDFNGDKREIFINGEVFADVAKNQDKPFVISAGDIHVKVLGTQFNFRAYNNLETVEVALVEGSVLFETQNQQKEVLNEGEIIQYNRSTQQINRELFLANQYKCPSKNEGFYFSNLSLGDIAKELEYNFDVKIIILDEDLNKNSFVAYFTNGETLDEILSDLNIDGRMSIKRSRDMIFIDKRHP